MYAAEQSGSSVFASMPIIPLLLGADKDRRGLVAQAEAAPGKFFVAQTGGAS